MVRRLVLPVFVALVTVSAVAPFTSAGAQPPLDFRPDSTTESTMTLSGRTFTNETDRYAIYLQKLNAEERQDWIERVTGNRRDPFASPEGKAERFITFLVDIQNKDDPEITFRAQKCWLVSDRTEIMFPVDMQELRATYVMAEREFPAAYESAGKALLSQSQSLDPGERATGLLVYRSPSKTRTKSIRLDLQLMTANGDAIMVSAPFLRADVLESRLAKQHKKQR